MGDGRRLPLAALRYITAIWKRDLSITVARAVKLSCLLGQQREGMCSVQCVIMPSTNCFSPL